MSNWRNEYLQALKDNEKKQIESYARIDNQLIEAFTSLLDRISALEAFKTATIEGSKKITTENSATSTTNRETARIRSDLAEALRSNGQLQSRTKNAEAEASRLSKKNKIDMDKMMELSRESAYLSQKLKDRDEELQGKTKLLNSVYDEAVSLNLQLNMSEQKLEDLRSENQFLIDRWMARKIHEWEKKTEDSQEYGTTSFPKTSN